MMPPHLSKSNHSPRGLAIALALSGGLVVLLLGSSLGRTLPMDVSNLLARHDQGTRKIVVADDEVNFISGLGITQPVGELRTIFANDSLNAHAVVEALVVEQGAAVQKGQVVAYLKGYQKARTMLAGLQHSLPPLETLVTLRREELSRSQMLFREGAGTQESTKLKEIDLHSTIRERQQLVGEINNARQSLDDLTVRAPVSGVVLKVNTREGERISPEEGLMILAPSSAIEVRAEIYETKVPLISIGDRAEIRRQFGSWERPVFGRVTSIGEIVNRSSLRPVNPRQELDARVVDVHILVDPDGQPILRRFVGSTVITTITKQRRSHE